MSTCLLSARAPVIGKSRAVIFASGRRFSPPSFSSMLSCFSNYRGTLLEQQLVYKPKEEEKEDLVGVEGSWLCNTAIRYNE